MRTAFVLSLLLLAALSGRGAGFDVPSENDRLNALGNLHEESAVVRRLLTPDNDFPPVRKPGRRDWLALQHEPGETFEAYRDSIPENADSARRIIYLLPIGGFDADASPPLEEIRAYAAIFFQREVRVLPDYSPADSEFKPRQNPRTGQRQIFTSAVTDFLKARLPADAACLLGVTMADLYPQPDWNYVFGEASLVERVGVYSFARYDPAFWGDERDADYRSLMLRRACKVLAHETGHMFGLPHCIHYHCLMNGAQHLVEADSNPQHACPICLRKLHHRLRFDPVARYRQLADFYRRHGWQDVTAWTERQLAKAAP